MLNHWLLRSLWLCMLPLSLSCATETPSSGSNAFEDDSNDDGTGGGGGHDGGDGGDGGSRGDRADDDYDCDGVPSFIRFQNVFVRDGAACLLDGVTVEGNVQVESGGSLELSDSVVEGNVQSDEGLEITILMTEVGGDIQVKETRPQGSVLISSNTVDGSIEIEENDTVVDVTGNEVRSDLEFFENVAASAHTIANNRVGQNLECEENQPDPIAGGGNTVGGDREDQCENL